MENSVDIKWIQSELDKVDDPALIEIFVRLLKYRNSMNDVQLEKYNKELDEANTRIETGKYISQENLEKEANQW